MVKTSGGREVRVGRPTCWWTEVACSRHRVTWAGPEEGRAGPCSLPWPPPPGHPNSMRCTVQWCPMLWTQVLNTNRSLGCRFWPLSPNGLGFTGPLEERGATRRSQVLRVVEQMSQHTSQRKVGLVGGAAAFEKPSRPPANGQEPGHPPRSSTLIARVLTVTEWPHRRLPFLGLQGPGD